jgi:hypothetical protein
MSDHVIHDYNIIYSPSSTSRPSNPNSAVLTWKVRFNYQYSGALLSSTNLGIFFLPRDSKPDRGDDELGSRYASVIIFSTTYYFLRAKHNYSSPKEHIKEVMRRSIVSIWLNARMEQVELWEALRRVGCERSLALCFSLQSHISRETRQTFQSNEDFAVLENNAPRLW